MEGSSSKKGNRTVRPGETFAHCLVAGDGVVYARRIETDDGEFFMRLHRAVVLRNCTDQSDNEAPCIKIRDEVTKEVYFEPLKNIYEILTPSESGSDPPATRCEGIAAKHFPATKVKSFRHICELMMDDKALLMADALHCRGRFLSHGILGLSHYIMADAVGKKSQICYHLRGGLGFNEISIHAIHCSIGVDPTVQAKVFGKLTTPLSDHPMKKKAKPSMCDREVSMRCAYCEQLKRIVSKKVNNRCRFQGKTTTNTTNNSVMTIRQNAMKLRNLQQCRISIGKKVRALIKQKRELIKKNAALEYKQSTISCVKFATQKLTVTNQQVAMQTCTALDTLEGKALKQEYYTRKYGYDTDKYRTAMAIHECEQKNMKTFVKKKNNNGFTYSPLVFREAINIFSGMSRRTYEQLRQTRPYLPSARYLTKHMYRNNHQPNGVQRSVIYQWKQVVDGLATTEMKQAAQVGQIGVDAMSIKSGLMWNNHTGTFGGLADEGSEKDYIKSKFHRVVTRITDKVQAVAIR